MSAWATAALLIGAGLVLGIAGVIFAAVWLARRRWVTVSGA